jgi:hypothetical protein
MPDAKYHVMRELERERFIEDSVAEVIAESNRRTKASNEITKQFDNTVLALFQRREKCQDVIDEILNIALPGFDLVIGNVSDE